MADTCASLSPYGLIESRILEEKHNLTALRTIQAPSWVSSPEVRGTTSILWSCIVTIFACIYTALHLNVPTETKWNRVLLSKTKWVICGLLAPEIVLYLAVSQFYEAWTLIKQLNGLVEQERDLEAGTGKHEIRDASGSAYQPRDAEACTCQRDEIDPGWIKKAAYQHDIKPRPHFDLRYGFFVAMGGLEVSVSDIEDHDETQPRGAPGSGRLRLSSRGVLQLAKDGHFLSIPISKIADKSKADTLQKALVMTQVLWMATTCIARKIYGLPLTLLEVHTLVHVICAAILYAFWLKKPKDIQDPEIVDSSSYTNLIALTYVETIRFGNHYDLDRVILYPRQGQARTPLPALKTISSSKPVEKVYLKDDNGNQRHVGWVEAGNPGPEGQCLEVGQAFTFGVGIGNYLSIPGGRFRFSRNTIERWKRIRVAVEDISGRIDEPEFFRTYQQPRYQQQHYHLE